MSEHGDCVMILKQSERALEVVVIILHAGSRADQELC
jgi:hypothetical protein